jgi:hypothetical protein
VEISVENTQASRTAQTQPNFAVFEKQNIRISIYRFSQQRVGKVAHAVTHIQQKKAGFGNFIELRKFPVTTRVSGLLSR